MRNSMRPVECVRTRWFERLYEWRGCRACGVDSGLFGKAERTWKGGDDKTTVGESREEIAGVDRREGKRDRKRRLTNSSCPTRRPDDQENDKDDAEAARDDVGDIAHGSTMADTRDATLGVDTDGGGRDIS